VEDAGGAIPRRRDRVGCPFAVRNAGEVIEHAFVSGVVGITQTCSGRTNDGGGRNGVLSGRTSGGAQLRRYPKLPVGLRGALGTIGDGQSEAEATNLVRGGAWPERRKMGRRRRRGLPRLDSLGI
jgi:hypothetical protein